MRKILSLLLILTFFVACGEKNKPDEHSKDTRLVNTKWRADAEITNIVIGEGHHRVIHFLTPTEFELYFTRFEKKTEHQGVGTYILSYPKVILQWTSKKGQPVTEIFIFERENTLVPDADKTDGTSGKYIKF